MSRNGQERSLSETAYTHVRERILSGVYPLGFPLSRRRLAEELGVSLVPVAEALNQLEVEGLVESQPRAGTRVRIPSVEEIRGHYLVREALESQAARLFAQMAGPAEKRELRRLAVALDALSARLLKPGPEREKRIAQYEKEHMAFHLRIAECSHSRELMEAIERSRVLVFNWLVQIAVAVEPLPTRWHRDLAEVLCAGDSLRADEAIRGHVTYRRNEYIAAFARLLPAREERFVRGPQRKAQLSSR